MRPSLALLLGIGCSDRTPARIEFSAPPAMILTTSPTPLGARAVNKAGEPVPEVTFSYSAIPTDVVAVEPDGTLACRKSGDAIITIAGGGLSTNATTKCRIAARVKAPKELRLVLQNEPVELKPTGIGQDGKPLTDVIPEMRSSDPAVVRVVGRALQPASVGKAVVTSAVGDASAVTEVEVIEKIETQTLALSDGANMTWTLQQGTYVVEVTVKAADRSRNGVTLRWVGTTCPDQPESQEIQARCRVDNTASLTVTNPTTFGMGPSASGFINIYKVP